MNKSRGFLYKLARLLGDTNSLKSPKRFVKRKVRKSVYRKVFKHLK